MDFYIVEIILTNGGGQMKNKLKLFIKQNGFLLFLFICVCAVAVGTVFLATQNLRAEKDLEEQELVILEEVKNEESDDVALEDTEQVSSIEDNTDDDVVTNEDEVLEVVEPEAAVTDEIVEETIATDKVEIEYVEEYEEEDIELVTNKPITSIIPVDGEILTAFTYDKLIYSETLAEWRKHSGIDIKAAEGTKVKVPLDGTIKEVIEDDLWGITIVIDHGDGLETRLSNLGTKEMVKPGIIVNRGDYISTVGKTASIEMLMEPHLHYELTKNGEIIDPRSITN